MSKIADTYQSSYLSSREDWYGDWGRRYEAFVKGVQETDHATWMTPSFQRELWENAAITGLGPGNGVTVEGAYVDKAIAQTLWDLRNWQRPNEVSTRADVLQTAYDRMLDALTPSAPTQTDGSVRVWS